MKIGGTMANNSRDVHIQVQVDLDKKQGWIPMRFICEATCIDIKEIMDKWPQDGNIGTYPTTYYFKIRGTDGYRYLLRHNVTSDKWYMDDRW